MLCVPFLWYVGALQGHSVSASNGFRRKLLTSKARASSSSRGVAASYIMMKGIAAVFGLCRMTLSSESPSMSHISRSAMIRSMGIRSRIREIGLGCCRSHELTKPSPGRAELVRLAEGILAEEITPPKRSM